MKAKTTKTPKRAAAAKTSVASGAGVCIATVARWDEEGAFVTLPHDERGPVEARVVVPPGASASGRAAEGASVVVMLDPGGTPVILGELRPVGEAPTAVARVDGRRVELVAEDEIVLSCGEASLVLRRNGRVVLRGVQIETHAKGLNRIKGGTVAIN